MIVIGYIAAFIFALFIPRTMFMAVISVLSGWRWWISMSLAIIGLVLDIAIAVIKEE